MEKCRGTCDVIQCLLFVVVSILLMQPVHGAATRGEYNIYDAFLVLDATMRNYGDKLERHEGRERQLGDTLRRALSSIDKRVALLQRSSEERHRELERFLIQAEERERIQLQKATQNVESLGSMLEARLGSIEALLQSNSKGQGEATPGDVPCTKLLEPKFELLQQKMGSLEEVVQNGAKELTKSTENIYKFEEGLIMNLDKSSNILEYLINNDTNKRKDTTDGVSGGSKSEEIAMLMGSISASLNTLNTQSVEAREVAEQAISKTSEVLQQIRDDIKAVSMAQADVLLQKFNEAQNTTLVAIEQAAQELEAKGDNEKGDDTCQYDNEFMAVRKEVRALSTFAEASKIELQKEVQNIGSKIAAEASQSHDVVLKKVENAVELLSPAPLLKILTDMEHVMLQAADGVMDVGRRVEHGNLRVISELGEEIKTTSSSVEKTITSRLDNLASSVLVNQTGAMETLSQRVESEISQVWRQIGIMYQQLTQSVGMLDKLQVQTENYVNGSLKSMGSVEGRVGEIGERVGEVEGNLNFLLGRLSLVATEFNLVKAGLAEALDDVRRNMASVNDNMKETAKGTEYDHVNQVSPIQTE